MELFIKIIAKYFQRFRNKEDTDENKSSTIIIQLVLIALFPVIYTNTLMPPGVSVLQIVSAGIAFFLIVIFALRILKYFKLM